MTVLIIGGAHQGKRALAQRVFGLSHGDIADGQICTPETIGQTRAVDKLHCLTRRYPKTDFRALLRGKIILCDEIGCGVVPADCADDAWREATGRLLCDIAAEADAVVRVLAGVPQVIKGELPWN